MKVGVLRQSEIIDLRSRWIRSIIRIEHSDFKAENNWITITLFLIVCSAVSLKSRQFSSSAYSMPLSMHKTCCYGSDICTNKNYFLRNRSLRTSYLAVCLRYVFFFICALLSFWLIANILFKSAALGLRLFTFQNIITWEGCLRYVAVRKQIHGLEYFRK